MWWFLYHKYITMHGPYNVKYVIRIDFPLQELLDQLSWMLRYTYIARRYRQNSILLNTSYFVCKYTHCYDYSKFNLLVTKNRIMSVL